MTHITVAEMSHLHAKGSKLGFKAVANFEYPYVIHHCPPASVNTTFGKPSTVMIVSKNTRLTAWIFPAGNRQFGVLWVQINKKYFLDA